MKPSLLSTQKVFKEKLHSILKSYPQSGVYKNEDKKLWNEFLKYVKAAINAEEGERGEISKKIRSDLSKIKDEINELFVDIKCNANTHIKEIIYRFKNYSPHPLHLELVKLKEGWRKAQEFIVKLNDEKFDLVEKIRKGYFFCIKI